MVRPEGLEPPTYWFVASHSIQLSYERMPSQIAYLFYHAPLQKSIAFFSLLSIFYSPGPWPVSKLDPGPLCLV